MAKKTLSAQLEEAKARIADLEAKEPQAMGLHELLDAASENLKNNRFYLRGVDSSGIASLVRSAREKLRIATKK